MADPCRVLPVFFSFLAVAFAPGFTPYRAAAQTVRGVARTLGAPSVVPRIGRGLSEGLSTPAMITPPVTPAAVVVLPEVLTVPISAALPIIDSKAQLSEMGKALAEAETGDEKAGALQKLFSGSFPTSWTIDVSKVQEDRKNLERHYAQAFRKMSDGLLSRSTLRIPQQPLVLEINPGINKGPPATSGRRPGQLHIVVPFRWIGDSSLKPGKKHPDGLYTKHPVHTLPILYHELGHVVFNENAKSSDSLFRDYIAAKRAVDQSARFVLELFDRLDRATNEDEKKSLDRLITESKKPHESVVRALNAGFARVDRILDGFNELFADLTAVLVAEDASVIAVAERIASPRGHSKAGRQFHSLHERDFKNPDNKLGVWKQTSDRHRYFSPVRHFLYTEYLRYPRFLNGPDKAKLYDAVFRAIITAAPLSLREEASALPGLSPLEMNRRLIAAISDELAP